MISSLFILANHFLRREISLSLFPEGKRWKLKSVSVELLEQPTELQPTMTFRVQQLDIKLVTAFTEKREEESSLIKS